MLHVIYSRDFLLVFYWLLGFLVLVRVLWEWARTNGATICRLWLGKTNYDPVFVGVVKRMRNGLSSNTKLKSFSIAPYKRWRNNIGNERDGHLRLWGVRQETFFFDCHAGFVYSVHVTSSFTSSCCPHDSARTRETRVGRSRFLFSDQPVPVVSNTVTGR